MNDGRKLINPPAYSLARAALVVAELKRLSLYPIAADFLVMGEPPHYIDVQLTIDVNGERFGVCQAFDEETSYGLRDLAACAKSDAERMYGLIVARFGDPLAMPSRLP